jgi:hypothetical protein
MYGLRTSAFRRIAAGAGARAGRKRLREILLLVLVLSAAVPQVLFVTGIPVGWSACGRRRR